VLDILYCRATGRPLHAPRDFNIPNCALNWFLFDSHGSGGRSWHLEAWDDQHHLKQVIKESLE
jgi:probable phosphoglycerate mutase